MAPPEACSNQPEALILKLPVEIVFTISKFLDPISAASFSLTCKSIHALLARNAFTTLRQERGAKKVFLQLLERDEIIGKSFYCCSGCETLHKYEEWPGNNLSLSEFWQMASDCRSGHFGWDTKIFDSSPLNALNDHVRLVMNRHFYGPSHGLPLESLNNISCVEDAEDLGSKMFLRASMDARIINDNLVLRREHILKPDRKDMTLKDFRCSVDYSYLYVCPHLSLWDLSRWNYHPSCERIFQIEDQISGQPFVPCEGELDYCSCCFTDTETTVECTDDSEREKCTITVVSYHLLGACREQNDDPVSYPYSVLGFKQGSVQYPTMTLGKRDFEKYPAGSVRQMWVDDVLGYPGPQWKPSQNPRMLSYKSRELWK